MPSRRLGNLVVNGAFWVGLPLMLLKSATGVRTGSGPLRGGILKFENEAGDQASSRSSSVRLEQPAGAGGADDLVRGDPVVGFGR